MSSPGIDDEGRIPLRRIARCCEGAVPAVVATCSADGTPNVTFLSRVHLVDDERVALSNQFFSKTAANLAENPRASLDLIDPVEWSQYRLSLVYERTERRGLLFDRLRADVDLLAALTNMAGVFRLRAADIYRVVDIEEIPANSDAPPPPHRRRERMPIELATERLGELIERLGRCPDANTLVDTALRDLAEQFGHRHSLLMLLDESGSHLYTIASHGYDDEGVGSEVGVGDGIVGITAERGVSTLRHGVRQMDKYSRRVRSAFEDHGVAPLGEIPVPRLALVDSQLAVPAMVFGQLVGVLMVETTEALAYDAADQAHLLAIASTIAHALEAERSDLTDEARVDAVSAGPTRPLPDHGPDATRPTALSPVQVRHYTADGSVFVEGDYLIRGVAGRALWHVLTRHRDEGRDEFTNKELRLDPTLGLPSFRDNLDSRLLLLKRRLEERQAPMRIVKSGRGRFRVELDAPLVLDLVAHEEGDPP